MLTMNRSLSATKVKGSRLPQLFTYPIVVRVGLLSSKTSKSDVLEVNCLYNKWSPLKFRSSNIITPCIRIRYKPLD